MLTTAVTKHQKTLFVRVCLGSPADMHACIKTFKIHFINVKYIYTVTIGNIQTPKDFNDLPLKVFFKELDLALGDFLSVE